MLKTGLIGTAVTGICCFTPLLPVLLGALGLAAWLAWADFVLLPLLLVFLAMTGVGLWRRRQKASS